MQEALVLSEMGEDEEAIATAREATEREPTNWETWAAYSRIGQHAGDDAVAQEGFDRGKELNPRSPVYGGEG